MLGPASVASILVATALLPSSSSATSPALRRLDAQSYLAVMSPPPPFCFVENGFDYVGNDLMSVAGSVDECCIKCAQANVGCTAWSWSNHNGGTCWLKSGRGDIVANPNVKSALLFRDGPKPTCQLGDGVDYPGNDLARVDSATPDGCCELCQKYAGCRAYTWSDYNGGSCWLKSKVTQVIAKPGVKSARAYPDSTGSCFYVLVGYDYQGYDIANKPSASYAGCCDLCKTVSGCRAYSWSNHNGGTCWLKSQMGQIIYNPGVTSAQVYPNTEPTCAFQSDTDYEGNDIANVPGKDAAECCVKCRGYTGCQAFAWSNLNGGTCWLKSKKGNVISKAGVSAGTL